MGADVMGSFYAFLTRDGVGKRYDDVHIEAPNREKATSTAVEWALGRLPTPMSGQFSLFMKIGSKEWLVRRFGEEL